MKPFPQGAADLCIHCGLCLPTCPTFVETGSEVESPRGRIYLLKTLNENRFRLDETLAEPLDHCLGCLACETSCPSGVPYRNLIEFYREQRTEKLGPRSRKESLLINQLIPRPGLLEMLANVYRLLGIHQLARGLAKLLPSSRAQRSLLLAPKMQASRPSVLSAPSPQDGPELWFHPGCIADAFYPADQQDSVSLLRLAGYRVHRMDEVSCCGALAHHAGFQKRAEQHTSELGQVLPPEQILVPSAAGCASHLKDQGMRVKSLARALLEAPQNLPVSFPGDFSIVVQDPCHARHGLADGDAVGELLRSLGANVVEPANQD
ncbi:MAG: (Fe-S)-binding protein, partial [Candidatus Eisenbacteria bacterium]|nr:(Fe-S)-binding protein [Candidatus Eisenbacteria bacterium]